MAPRLLHPTSSVSGHWVSRPLATSGHRTDLPSRSSQNALEGTLFPQPTVSMERLGVVMEPQPGNLNEVEGVLNPATARGPDGELYLLPRLVGAGNYSRIGLARVLFDEHGNPEGVERMATVLEPETDYERNTRNGGGVEDPRVSFLAPWCLYVMTYTAYGTAGPS